MLKRIVYIGNPFKVSVKYGQLICENRDRGETKQVPIEDLACLMLDHPQVTVTLPVFQQLAENNVSVIICDEKHHPASILFHIATHQVQNERYRYQVAAPEPLKKQLWMQTVKAKINNQSEVLKSVELNHSPVKYHISKVKSGDMSNEEAKASRKYWNIIFGNDFRRERFGLPPNSLLNYGYAIVRAAIARALAGSGLLPALGIHHHNRYNAFCLADDIIEPYRPFVDLLVYRILKDDPVSFHVLDKDKKAAFLSLLSSDVMLKDNKSPMMVAMQRTTSSLALCFEKKRKRIDYPTIINGS